MGTFLLCPFKLNVTFREIHSLSQTFAETVMSPKRNIYNWVLGQFQHYWWHLRKHCIISIYFNIMYIYLCNLYSWTQQILQFHIFIYIIKICGILLTLWIWPKHPLCMEFPLDTGMLFNKSMVGTSKGSTLASGSIDRNSQSNLKHRHASRYLKTGVQTGHALHIHQRVAYLTQLTLPSCLFKGGTWRTRSTYSSKISKLAYFFCSPYVTRRLALSYLNRFICTEWQYLKLSWTTELLVRVLFLSYCHVMCRLMMMWGLCLHWHDWRGASTGFRLKFRTENLLVVMVTCWQQFIRTQQSAHNFWHTFCKEKKREKYIKEMSML